MKPAAPSSEAVLDGASSSGAGLAGPGYRDDPELMRWVEGVGRELLSRLLTGRSRHEPVVRYTAPLDNHAAFAGHVPLSMGPGGEPSSPAALDAAVQEILRRSVHSSHPRFFNQNWAGADPVAVLGDWLTSVLNTTAATYEMAPVFTLMENELLFRMAVLVGFAGPAQGPRVTPGAHGLFAPGGAVSNLYAMHLARAHADPEVGDSGLFGGAPLVAFTSEQSHYAFAKSAALLGLGRRQLVHVPCDDVGRMQVPALISAIREVRSAGGRPFFVNATAGTTVAGAFDPIDDIADVAEAEGLWLHVDGCYGGSALFSARHRALLAGSQRAHSFAWNPHKMMGITQQCAALLLREGAPLRPAFAAHASYIFQTDKNDADQDLGDLSFQCGRRPDGLKLWLTWKARGERWFEARIDRAVELAERLERRLAGDPRFCLAHPRSFANVGFWWVPEDLRPLDPTRMSEATKARLHGLAPKVKDKLQREGSAMLGFQPLGERPNFFRLLVMSPDVRESDVEATIERIDHFAARL